jgi:hypothetical protein
MTHQRPHQALLGLAAFMAMSATSPPLAAATICRWVDASGRTQLAEVVPERYKAVAVCTDSKQYELSPAQQEAAAQRRADAQAKAARAAASAPPAPASAAAGPAGAASRPRVKRPAEMPTAATPCATWWRLYDESVACFGPYRTTRGATKVEAFDVCNEVPSPVPKCGPRVD